MSQKAEDVYSGYLLAIENGDSLTIDDVIATHPQLADELRELHDMEGELSDTLGSPDREPNLGSDARARYRIDAPIGLGGMSTVFRVLDHDFDREVAMKVCDRDDDRLSKRFAQETTLTAQLQHPNVVPIHDRGVDADGRPYFTMKLVDGNTIEKHLKVARNSTRALRHVIDILLRVCDAVAYAHSRGVIHRDLKPANVMVGSFGEVFVVDWGLAAFTPRGSEQPEREVVGTPAYMAPEQTAPGAEPTPSCDVYSIGAILYQALTGHAPLGGRDLARRDSLAFDRDESRAPRRIEIGNRRAPPELVAICNRAMEHHPEDRYPDVRALKADLQGYLHDDTITAYEPWFGRRVLHWCRRNPIAFGLLLAIATASIYGHYRLTELGVALSRRIAIDGAHLKAELLDQVQRSYSCYVAARVDPEKTPITHDFLERPGAVPIPSTFMRELAIDISEAGSGLLARQFSDQPFKFRKATPLDAFQLRSLRELRADPNAPISTVENIDGREMARFAVARTMTATCVQCHNSHPDSPRHDWKAGDVRGVLEVMQPVDMHPEDRQRAIRSTFLGVGGLLLAIWLLSGFAAHLRGRG